MDSHSPSPSEIGALIMENVVSGNLAKLNEIKTIIGDVAMFRGMCDLYSYFTDGRRVLHTAAEMGRYEICEFLIDDVGVIVDVLTYKGDTPLMLAVKEEHLEVVEYLIRRGALLVVSNSKGFTSLHYAVQKENLGLINLLLENDANIEAESVDGTPLQCAASLGSVKAAKFLLGRRAKPNPDSLIRGSPLISAIKSQSFKCMELLLEDKADPNSFFFGLTPLARAAQYGDTKYLNRLIAAGANPDLPCTDRTKPIEHAALVYNREAVEILFPLTQPIPHYPNWTVDGIMTYCSQPQPINAIMESIIETEGLLVEVLLRVPSKALLKFKVVCKRWLHLISSEWFSRKQTLHLHMQRGSVLFLQTCSGDKYYHMDLNTKIVTWFKFPRSHVKIKDSCSGLLLLHHTDVTETIEVEIYNPTTRQVRTISLNLSQRYRVVSDIRIVLEPSVTPFYKVVFMRSTVYGNEESQTTYQIDIYDSTHHAWTYTSGDIQGPRFSSCGVLWNNVVYWCSENCISFFNYDQKLRLIRTPPKQKACRYSSSLHKANGSLYLVQLVEDREGHFSVVVWERHDRAWELKDNLQVASTRNVVHLMVEEDHVCVITNKRGMLKCYSRVYNPSLNITDLASRREFREFDKNSELKSFAFQETLCFA